MHSQMVPEARMEEKKQNEIFVKIVEPIGPQDQNWIDKIKNSKIHVECADTRSFDEQKMIHFIHDAHALVLANRPLSKKILDSCPRLEFLSVAFTGTDHIDMKTCEEKNIAISTSAGYSTTSVSELALCLALHWLRNFFQVQKNLTSSGTISLGSELYGKTVGIIGGGAIGCQTAKLFSAFHTEVLLYHRRKIDLPSFISKQVPFEELLQRSDIVSLHLPLVPETRNLLNQKALFMMKPTALLINTSRGPIIDQDALIEALRQQKIGGAALDVFDHEPPLEENHPLLKAPNVILTPHIGYRTKEAILRRADMAFRNLGDWLNQKMAGLSLVK